MPIQQIEEAITFDTRHPDHVGRETRIHEQRASSCRGMYSHHRVNHRRNPEGVVVQLLSILAVQAGIERFSPVGERRDAVNRLEFVEGPAKGRMQCVVGGPEVDPAGVSTPVGYVIGDENRRRRWRRHEGDIGVPSSVLSTIPGVEHQDLRMVGVSGHHRVGRSQFAQLSGDVHLLGGAQVLVPKDQDRVLLEEAQELPGTEIGAEVDTGEFRTEGSGDGSSEAADAVDGGHEGTLARIRPNPIRIVRYSGIVSSMLTCLPPDVAEHDAPAILQWAERRFQGGLVFTCSFEDPVLVHLVAGHAPSARIVLLDTQYLFDETIAYAERLRHLIGFELSTVRPSDDVVPDELWRQDLEECCRRRKVEPLQRALAGAEAWITGVRRVDGPTRAATPPVAFDALRGVTKINPLVAWSDDDVSAYAARHALPENPLVAQGYPSIGCWPCTRPVAAGEDRRAGRWSGAAKTECGLHLS